MEIGIMALKVVNNFLGPKSEFILVKKIIYNTF